MAKLVWDQVGTRAYETGVDRGVLYPFVAGESGSVAKPGEGVAWSGLTSVEESPSGGDVSKVYADNIDYLALTSVEEYGYTIGAYTYPDEFAECDGSKEIGKGVTIGQQNRKHFAFSYRSLVGNDTDGTDHGYKIYLIYNSLAAPSSKTHSTVNDSPEAGEMSWECSTVKVDTGIEGMKPTSCLTIDSTKVEPAKLKKIEDILYGTAEKAAAMPTPAEVLEILNASA